MFLDPMRRSFTEAFGECDSCKFIHVLDDFPCIGCKTATRFYYCLYMYIDPNRGFFTPCCCLLRDSQYDKEGLINLRDSNNARDREESFGCILCIFYASWVGKGSSYLEGKSPEYNSLIKKNYKITRYKSCCCFIPCKSVDLEIHPIESYNRDYTIFTINDTLEESKLYDNHVTNIISDYLFEPQPQVIV